jgi:hypothetical protein
MILFTSSCVDGEGRLFAFAQHAPTSFFVLLSKAQHLPRLKERCNCTKELGIFLVNSQELEPDTKILC